MKEQLEDAIAEIGGEPLKGSGFESEKPDDQDSNLGYDSDRGRPEK